MRSHASEHRVDAVGCLEVLERQRVCVVSQRRRRISMPEPMLGAQEIASADKEGGDGVPQAVKGDTGQARLVAQPCEPVAHRARRETLLVICLPGEEPRPERRVVWRSRTPGRHALAPQGRRGGPEREPSNATSLRRANLLGRHAALDGEDSPVEVSKREGRQLTSPRAGVCSEPQQQPELLGTVQLS